jgi:hypothetical protein
MVGRRPTQDFVNGLLRLAERAAQARSGRGRALPGVAPRAPCRLCCVPGEEFSRDGQHNSQQDADCDIQP